jgi:hypothetical protein
MEIIVNQDAWVFLGGTVAAVSSVVIAHINSRRKQDTMEAKVDETIALSKPTGNGFAQQVKDSLARVELAQAALVLDVSSLKEKVSEQAVAHARLEGKMDGHLVSRQLALPSQYTGPAQPPQALE